MKIEEAVKLRLKMFKIDVTEEDTATVDYLIQKALNSINNITNQNYTEDTFPPAIFEIWVDKAVGEYLNLKKLTGELPESYDLSMAVSQIKEGDTSVSFSGSSDEEKLNVVIGYFLSGRDSELIRYRRLLW